MPGKTASASLFASLGPDSPLPVMAWEQQIWRKISGLRRNSGALKFLRGAQHAQHRSTREDNADTV